MDAPAPGDTPLFQAITEQLGGRFRITRGPSGGGVCITFPTEVQPAGQWNPVAARLH